MAEQALSRAGSMPRFAGGVLLGLIAEQTVLFAVPLLIYQDTRNIAYSGAAFALEWLPALIAYPFAGLLADRLGGRHLFLRANVARASCLAITLAVYLLVPSLAIWALMLNGVFLSLLIAPVRMAVEKMVPVLAKGDSLPRWQSVVQNMELLAMALGSAIAATLVQFSGKLPLIGMAGATFLLSAWCWRGMRFEQRSSIVAARIRDDLKLGWKLLLGNRPVLLLALLNFLINLAFAVALSANPYLIKEVFGASDTVFGLMNAGAGALGLLNLLFIPWLLRSLSIYQLGALGFALLCFGLACMGMATGAWFYVTAFLLAMAGVALFNVFNRTQRVKAIHPDHLGKVIGPFYLLNLLSYPLGGILTATVGQSVSVQQVVLFFAFMLALPGTALLWLTASRFREVLGTSSLPHSPS